MTNILRFDPERYAIKTFEEGGARVACRAFEGIDYCARPASGIQKLNIYVPEGYYEGGTINGYTLKTAPIFMPNTVGGYMQGPAMVPGIDRFNGQVNSALRALEHGYVVACAGIRGRNTGMKSDEFFVGGNAGVEDVSELGELTGRAPALAVDMKAAIRYLRHNADVVPGDVERIVTNGTSAGGALSAIPGATGNHPDYQPCLEAIGAADAQDDIFAASCYCPIHNLENADAAYEWLFCGEDEYHRMKFVQTDHGVERAADVGRMSDRQIILSKALKAMFPAYLTSLDLRDEQGNPLTLDDAGEGSFKAYVREAVIASAQRELDTHWAEALRGLFVEGANVDRQAYLTIENGRVAGLDWDGFVHAITRMKQTPAFDDLKLLSPECEEFGDGAVFARHFTEFAQRHTEVPAELADDALVKLLNPVRYIGSADCAPHWRVRHGAYDRDTSLAIPVILATMLKNHGIDVDFHLPWGLPHSGDYDLDELFAWIDGLCRQTGE